MLTFLLLLLALATLTDLRSHRIPNVLSLGGLVVGVVWQTVSGGLEGAGQAVLGMLAGLALFLPFYVLKGMAAGDVKLMAAIGAFVGPKLALVIAGASMICGAGLAVGYVCFSGGGRATLKRYGLMAKHLWVTKKVFYIPPGEGDGGKVRFPFALALLVGTAAGLWWQTGALLG